MVHKLQTLSLKPAVKLLRRPAASGRFIKTRWRTPDRYDNASRRFLPTLLAAKNRSSIHLRPHAPTLTHAVYNVCLTLHAGLNRTLRASTVTRITSAIRNLCRLLGATDNERLVTELYWAYAPTLTGFRFPVYKISNCKRTAIEEFDFCHALFACTDIHIYIYI